MKTFVLLTLHVFVVKAVAESNLVSVMEGHLVTLKSDVIKQGRDKMLWYFNDTLIALINGDPTKSCLYDGEGEVFKGRLEVDFQTGSLTITDIRPEHTGRYEANFIKSISSGTSQSLNRNSKCDSGKILKKKVNIGDIVKTFSVSVKESHNEEKKQEDERGSSTSSGLFVGICAAVGGVVLLASAVLGLIYYRRRISKMEDMEKNTSEQMLNGPA